MYVTLPLCPCVPVMCLRSIVHILEQRRLRGVTEQFLCHELVRRPRQVANELRVSTTGFGQTHTGTHVQAHTHTHKSSYAHKVHGLREAVFKLLKLLQHAIIKCPSPAGPCLCDRWFVLRAGGGAAAAEKASRAMRPPSLAAAHVQASALRTVEKRWTLAVAVSLTIFRLKLGVWELPHWYLRGWW